MEKSFYCMNQVPRTWYARLDKYLTKLGFVKGTKDGNL